MNKPSVKLMNVKASSTTKTKTTNKSSKNKIKRMQKNKSNKTKTNRKQKNNNICKMVDDNFSKQKIGQSFIMYVGYFLPKPNFIKIVNFTKYLNVC